MVIMAQTGLNSGDHFCGQTVRCRSANYRPTQPFILSRSVNEVLSDVRCGGAIW